MISHDVEVRTEKVDTPFAKSVNNSEQFFLVDRVVAFSGFILRGFERDRTSGIPGRPKGENGPDTAVASIGSNIDIVVVERGVVNRSEALS